MADATPIDSNVRRAARPVIPLWPRKWQGFPSTTPVPIGREREVGALCDLLRDRRRRLVTATGPGGVGKTRLALAAAERLAPEFVDGAAFVALDTIADPALILPAIARVLEVREAPGRVLPDALMGSLRDRQLLLVLDNFEHLVGAAAVAAVTELLERCPEITMLATSRTPLHLHEERVFATPTLAVPHASVASDPSALREFGAVALFVERARMVDREFALTTANAAAVVEICQRLDGLPLAIELAAAWTRLLPPAALLARLEPGLPMLRGGALDQPVRFRAMHDAIAWSYDLLSDVERRFFLGLGVFVGGWTLEAADWVSGAGFRLLETGRDAHPAGPDIRHPIPDTLDLLASLIDKSLVQLVRADGAEPRFVMMETVREFARERLAETGDSVIAEAHAAYYLNLAETAASAAGGAARESWMRRIATERPNLRAALDWFRQSGQAGAALQMTGALWHYWYRLGELSEGRAWLEQTLAAAPPDVALDLRARALRGAGVLAWQSADYDGSREWLEAALTAYETLHDRTGAAWVLNSLGCLYATRADRDQAEKYLTASLAIFREFDDAVGIAQLTANLGELAQAAGDHHLAIERLEAALTMWRALGDRVSAARALVFLGQALLERGESARAEAALLEALTIIRDVDYEQILPTALRVFALLTAARGDVAAAARWYGAEDTLRHTLGITLPAARRAAHEEAVAAARKKLGATAFDVAWAAGRTLSPEDVVAEMFASAHTATTAVPAGALPATGLLSRREREVLALLIEGHSDRTIADALFISQRTASDHVGAILRKLNVSTRAEAAVRAVRDGLG